MVTSIGEADKERDREADKYSDKVNRCEGRVEPADNGTSSGHYRLLQCSSILDINNNTIYNVDYYFACFSLLQAKLIPIPMWHNYVQHVFT